MTTRDDRRLIYSNIEDALASLNAEDKGRYFLCTCPECQQSEAFIYKNNLSFIQCNRENECGERMLLHFEEKKQGLAYQKKEITYPALSNEQVRALSQLTALFKHMESRESPTLDNNYRGLSRETLRPFVVDLLEREYVANMFKSAESLLLKNYEKSEWMSKRNLVFPIYGEDGLVERISLRSSIEPNIEPKEIQLVVNPSKETRDFFIDIPKKAETVVIGEAILDSLSFREVDANVGIIGLTGAAKTRLLCKFISENKEIFQGKKIVLALDNDEAGRKAAEKIVDALKKINVRYQLFSYPENIKDPNDYLNKDRQSFEKAYKNTLRKMQRRNQRKCYLER